MAITTDKLQAIMHPIEDYRNKLIVRVWYNENYDKTIAWLKKKKNRIRNLLVQ